MDGERGLVRATVGGRIRFVGIYNYVHRGGLDYRFKCRRIIRRNGCERSARSYCTVVLLRGPKSTACFKAPTPLIGLLRQE